MFVILLGLVAAASAAPSYPYSNYGASFDFHHGFRSPHFQEEIFDTHRFWSDLSTELRQLDSMLEDFYKHFPSTQSQAGIVGNEYKIIIPLNGFEEKDIAVKAREGLLMVQAVHKYEAGNVKNYIDVRVLPSCVNVTGNWIYDDNVLKITFPLKEGTVTEAEVTPTEPTDARPTETTGSRDVSREEMEPVTDNNTQDADVGAGRGDVESFGNQHKYIVTNDISDSNVEATTYSVDLKNEIEFVPVRYR